MELLEGEFDVVCETLVCLKYAFFCQNSTENNNFSDFRIFSEIFAVNLVVGLTKGGPTMINLGIYIPIEYHYAKIDYCEKQLSNLPVVRSGRHGNRNVLRIYSKDHICREVSTRSKTWDKAAAICNKREKLTATIKSIRKTLAKDYRGVTPSDFTLINTENKFDNDFYDSIKDCSCTYAKNEAYFYNGRHYRSRAEMDFAAQLDYFGLEYKYDVEFVLNGKKFSVDFLIAFSFIDFAFDKHINIILKSKVQSPI